MKKDTVAFEQLVSRGCGLDVHKEIVVVTIQGKGIKTMTKSFHTYTSSLIKLRDWLKKHKITHIAMESTGVYWKPIYNPKQLLSMVHGCVKANRKAIEESLTGYVTAHHRLMLKKIWKNMHRLETTLSEVDRSIEKAIEPLQIELDLLEQIPGVGKKRCYRYHLRNRCRYDSVSRP